MLFFLIITVTLAQERVTLEFPSEKWNIQPTHYFISAVFDERTDKTTYGKALLGNKPVPVVFRNSLETDLFDLVNGSIVQDTSKVPFAIGFDKFVLKETGNTTNHRATVDFSMKFYRIIGEKKYKIFETNGTPHLDMRGPYPDPHAKIISGILKSALKNFDEWINKHPDFPPLAKSVFVTFEKRDPFISGDTIFWNESYKLKWSDFKGKPDGNPFMALSNCAFYYKPVPVVKNGVMEIQFSLFANFDRSLSWVKPDQHKDTLLAHEQLHFDICELHIRKLKKRIRENEYNPMEFESQMHVYFQEAWSNYMNDQQKYDDETQHGIVSEKQQSWQEIVRMQLNKISDDGIVME